MSDFRAATSVDIPTLRRLIESAYRGDSAKAGWTHEADLLGGDRTSDAELAGIIADPDQVLLMTEDEGEAVGCVRVMRQADGSTYLGMLTVSPGRQAGGLGRALLAAAETEAIARFAAPRMEMTVISTRSELIAWYERRGYALTGERRPFPLEARDFGDLSPQTLEFVVLAKPL
ncbi:MAG: GNAT family N-acetyltransferase [Brevundimonas sp.]|uniref:GNAT family N-acetyltransferase n=1 Tax=Brevundimonas sp. TaxID=1871086 RepID=UPI004034E0A5